MLKTVHVLLVRGSYIDLAYAFSSKEKAVDRLYELVKERWDEIANEGENIHPDKERAIYIYFTYRKEYCEESESYEILELTVDE